MIYIAGDSHVFSYQHYEKWRVEWIGAALAYLIDTYLPPTLVMMERYRDAIKHDDFVAMMVGEIDCRWSIPKHADERQESDEENINRCVERFVTANDALAKGYPVVVFGVHPSTTHQHNITESGRSTYPYSKDHVGMVWSTPERRNAITRAWNDHLSEWCRRRDVPFLSIYDYLVGADGTTDMSYYLDYCHLNGDMVVPFWEQEMKRLGIEI